MKYIKEYKEVKEETTKVYVVILQDVGGNIVERFAFKLHMKAADKFIKLVNDNYDTNFEPYYEEGERLFTAVDENPDFLKAVNCVQKGDENSDPYIYLLDINLEE
jgi:hypothetical protein